MVSLGALLHLHDAIVANDVVGTVAVGLDVEEVVVFAEHHVLRTIAYLQRGVEVESARTVLMVGHAVVAYVELGAVPRVRDQFGFFRVGLWASF